MHVPSLSLLAALSLGGVGDRVLDLEGPHSQKLVDDFEHPPFEVGKVRNVERITLLSDGSIVSAQPEPRLFVPSQDCFTELNTLDPIGVTEKGLLFFVSEWVWEERIAKGKTAPVYAFNMKTQQVSKWDVPGGGIPSRDLANTLYLLDVDVDLSRQDLDPPLRGVYEALENIRSEFHAEPLFPDRNLIPIDGEGVLLHCAQAFDRRIFELVPGAGARTIPAPEAVRGGWHLILESRGDWAGYGYDRSGLLRINGDGTPQPVDVGLRYAIEYVSEARGGSWDGYLLKVELEDSGGLISIHVVTETGDRDTSKIVHPIEGGTSVVVMVRSDPGKKPVVVGSFEHTENFGIGGVATGPGSVLPIRVEGGFALWFNGFVHDFRGGVQATRRDGLRERGLTRVLGVMDGWLICSGNTDSETITAVRVK